MFSDTDIRRLCDEVDGKAVCSLSDEQQRFVEFACLYGRRFGIALTASLPDERVAEFRKLFLNGADKAVLNDFQREHLRIRVFEKGCLKPA